MLKRLKKAIWLDPSRATVFEVALETHTDIDVVRSWPTHKMNEWIAYLNYRNKKMNEK